MLNDLTIKQIQELVDKEGLNKDLLNKLKQDPRKGVKRILQNAIIKEETMREKTMRSASKIAGILKKRAKVAFLCCIWYLALKYRDDNN